MKLIATLLFILTFYARANAAQFSLVKIDAVTYESHIQEIRKAIASDHAEPVAVSFYKDQSFLLKGDKGQREAVLDMYVFRTLAEVRERTEI